MQTALCAGESCVYIHIVCDNNFFPQYIFFKCIKNKQRHKNNPSRGPRSPPLHPIVTELKTNIKISSDPAEKIKKLNIRPTVDNTPLSLLLLPRPSVPDPFIIIIIIG